MGTRSYLTAYGVARNVPRTGEERAGALSRASMRLGQGRARASPCFFGAREAPVIGNRAHAM
jgi:hypothetical protein